MLRAGVSFLAVMKLLGHTSPEMTMRYLDVALTDLQREFELARSKPRHLVPQPKTPFTPRAGADGLIEGVKKGAAYFDLSTNAQSMVKKIHEEFAAKGAHMLDAPVVLRWLTRALVWTGVTTTALQIVTCLR